jgi:hypothetical protein
MTVCSTERGRGGLALLLALLLACGPALAQVQQLPARPTALGPPLPLGPAPAAPAPQPATPLPAPGTPSDAAIDAAAEAAAKATITVNPLQGSGLDGVGTLDVGNGGLGADLWRDSDRPTIERLLPLLAPPENALALRETARRLLLSAAPPPAGSGGNFVLLRAERLAAIGDIDAAAALAGLLPERDRDAAAVRLLADAAWLAGDVGGGCKLVEGALPRLAADAGIARAGIFCQAQAGQKDKAALGLDLLRDQGQAGDPLFAALIDKLAGGPPAKLDSVTGLTPLLYAMLRTAGQGLPPEAASAVPLPIAAALARDAKAAPEARLAAAERAAGAGLIDAAALARIYALQPASPAELDGAARATEPPGSPRARALLFQAAQRGAPAARAPLVQRALEQGRRDGDYRLVARLYLPVLRDLPPATGTPAFAAEAATALTVAGYRDRAAPWLAAAAADKSLAGRLWLLQRLAKGGPLQPTPADQPTLAAWHDAAKAADPATADLQLARLLALCDGLGSPVDGLWPTLIGAPALAQLPPPDPALLAALSAAAYDRRKGEGTLLALAALGRPEPRQASPAALAPAISALRRLDQAAAARDLALDAAIGNGL